MRKRFYRTLSLILAILLLTVQEAPAYAQGLSDLNSRLAEEREIQRLEEERLAREKEIFTVQEGLTLSDNGFPQNPASKKQDGMQQDRDGMLQNTQDQTEGSDQTLRMPELDAQDPDLLYGDPVETGKNYKTYRLQDGSYKTIFTTYANTYMDGTEEKPIDNTLIPENGAEGEVYVNKESDIEITLPAGENEDNTVSIAAAEMEALLQPEDGNYAQAAVSGNAIRYNNVHENVDIQYTVQPCGLKQDIILTAPQEKNTFSYRLAKNGIRAELKDGCIYLYEENGSETVGETGISGNEIPATVSANSTDIAEAEPVMVISAPRMEDAAGASSDAIELELMEKEDEYRIVLTADAEWLRDETRIYPIKIDPSTIVLQSQIVNYTIASLSGAMREQPVSYTGYFDGLGKTRSYVITNYLYQSVMFGQKDVEILSASMNIYQLNNNTGFQIGCYRLNEKLPSAGQTWDNTINIDRYAAGENCIQSAGAGWHQFDVRDAVNGWTRATYDSHGLVLISTNETLPGAMFATENYPDSSLTPTLEIVWQPAGDIPFDYPLDDTTINLRPMTLTTTSGKMQCYGVFADGIATPGAYVAYTLSDTSKKYNGVMYTGNEKLYPDSSSFQSIFPQGTTTYLDRLSNWQTAYPFTEYDTDTVYTISAQAAAAGKTGSKTTSDEFLIYRVTRYDTMQKIADYYGVPLSTLLFDNKAADTLLVENNTLFIRSPQRNKNTPYQPSELTDEEKAAIDNALLGRALHCEYGFEPINLNTGNFFLAQEDFAYTDSYGTFALQRSYNGLNADRMGSFGRGFTSLFDENISSLSDGTIIYNRQDGSSLSFCPDGKGGYQTPEGYQLTLTKTKTGEKTGTFSAGEQTYSIYRYDITREDKSICSFDETGNLIQIRGEKGDILSISRDKDGRLTGITREGITMGITTTPEGCISSITTPNGGIYRYTYDNNQNLSKVTDPLGGTKTFIYDSSHRMSAWYDENGTRVVKNTYDSKDRVISQIDELGGQITLQYEDGKTIATDAKGNITTYEYDDQYRTTAIHYPDGTTETREYKNNQLTKQTDRLGIVTTFTYDGNGNITEKNVGDIQNTFTYDTRGELTGCTDALGNTTTAEYDTNGNLLKLTEADGSTMTYRYDSRNRLIEETDANGSRYEYTYSGNFLSTAAVNGTITGTYTYGSMGQLLSLKDGEDNTITYTYDLMNRMTSVKTPMGSSQTIAYDRKGLVLSVKDAYGQGTSYTYDGCANILSITDACGNRYEYTYDANGNRISETDPYGNVTTNEYDEMDRLVKVTDKQGGIYTYAYDGGDRLTRAADPDGGEMTITYAPYYDLPLTITDPEGTITEYTYDANGNVLSMIRAGEETVSYEYDARGQQIKTTYANGLEETMEYDGNGNCILITDQNGRDITMEYDPLNRLIRETTPSGNTYEYTYDKAGNLTAQTDPLGNRISFIYDGNGNILSQTDGEGNITTYAYDLNDRLILKQNADGGENHYVYDALGRLTASTDGLGYVTSYEYDSLGNLTVMTDPLGNRTSYSYDALSRMITETDALGRTTTYAYDAGGSLISATDALGGVTVYTYDKNDRLTSMTDALGNITSYEYDALSRLTKETDALGGVRLYEYDAAGSLTGYTDENGARTAYAYDIYGNIISETDANNNKTEYTYSIENELNVIRNADGGITRIGYDVAGNITAVTDPLGNKTTYAYDKNNRLIKETAADGGRTLYAYDSMGNVAEITDSLSRTTAYAYDVDGNLTGITDPAGNLTAYTYDPMGRVTAVTYADGTQSLAAYDAVGNLTFTKEGGENLTEYTYDALNRCIMKTDAMGNETGYSYDAVGNLTKETAPDNSTTTYVYDAADRLTAMTLANDGTYAYAYDKAGSLIKVTGPTGITTTYSYDAVGNLLTLNKAGSMTEYSYDALNRVTKITDALGGETAYTYDKAGNLTNAVYADGASYAYQYDALGRNVIMQTPAGLQINNTYDTEGQLTVQTLTDRNNISAPAAAMAETPAVPAALTSGLSPAVSADTRKTTLEYDALGNVTAITDALGGKTTYTYDALSRVTKTVSPMGVTEAYTYDSLGNIATFTDGEDYTTTYAYDAKGRLTEKNIAGEEIYTYAYDSRDRLTAVAGENSLVTYRYDAVGSLTAVTDGNGSTTLYEYDKAGKLTKTLDPLGNQHQYEYDEAGNLTKSTDENGNTTEYDYDALNRLVKKDTGETLSTASYEYDAMGRLTCMDDVTGESLYTYDEAGRLLSATDGNGKQLTYHYDVYGNVTEVTYPDGRAVTYTYDAADRMISVTTLEGKTTRYEYDGDGNLTRVEREDGETTITYDKKGQIICLANTSGGQIISIYGYAYDGRGNVTREKSRILQEGKMTSRESVYTYDGKSQLIKAVQTEDGQSPAATTYTYDPAGNRLCMETEKDGQTLTVEYTYDKGGRLTQISDSQGSTTTYEYDKAGNLITEKGTKGTADNTDAGNGINTATERHYLYDASDRLTAVTDKDTLLLAALYDGNDNRTFTMEYEPKLQPGGSAAGKEEEKETGYAGGRTTSAPGEISQNAIPDERDGREDPGSMENDDALPNGENSSGAKAFWYGLLCQTADLLLPCPTAFKAWLHEKMGFTDSITVLWTKEVYEADLGYNTQTVSEAGSPFALIEDIFADTTQMSLASDAYRQVSYVNDVSYANTQVLMEYAVNGGMGKSTTAYSYGLQRESYSMTESLCTVGPVIEGMTITSSGIYYYTGSGSVSNLVSSAGSTSYSYAASGETTIYSMNGTKSAGNSLYGTYGAYSYNGEYTHENLGLQYLRARYYNMTTGTFTSRDSYAGTLVDILSQNRYTYAENNPVTMSDPSGHFSLKGAISAAKAGVSAVKTAATAAVKSTVSKVATAVKSAATAASVNMMVSAVNSITKSTMTVKSGNNSPTIAKVLSSGVLASVSPSNVLSGNIYQKGNTADDNFTKFLNIAFGPHLEIIADAVGAPSWVVNIAAEVEKKKCEAYNYCINKKQEIIPERMNAGTDLFEKSFFEAIAGATFLVIGCVTCGTGVGALGIPAGIFGLTAAAADAGEAVQEIEYGWTGNATAESENFLRDNLFEGNKEIYDTTTTVVGALGLLLFFAAYPALAATSVGTCLGAGGNTGQAGNAPSENEVIVLKHQATSGVELKSTPGKTTTVLGRYNSDTRAIINELGIPKNTDFSGNPGGFNLLNTPDNLYYELGSEEYWLQYNKPFLDAAISRGDEIIMATPIVKENLYEPGTTEFTGYGREYFYLLKCGYEYENGRMILKK